MHFLITSETIKANKSYLSYKGISQNTILIGIVIFKYAQIFQK